MSRLREAALHALLLTLAAGCQSSPPGEDFRIRRPLPYRIYLYLDEGAMAAEAVGPDREEERGDQEGEAESTGPIPIDLQRIEEALEAAVRAHDLCTELLTPEAAGGDLAASLADARARDADLFLRIRSRGPPSYSFSHYGAWFLPNTLLWFVLGFPSFWVRDRFYAIDWPISYHIHSVSGYESLLPAPEPLALQSHVALNVHERGFSARALYTPPGLYDGPHVDQKLKPYAERLLVDEILNLLNEEDGDGRDVRDARARIELSRLWGSEIEILSPRNLSAVDVGTTELRIKIDAGELVILRLELDGRILAEYDTISMPDLARPLKLPLGDVLERLDRFDRVPARDDTPWSASKTIRFSSVQGEHRLRVRLLESSLARSRSPQHPVGSFSGAGPDAKR